MRAESKTLAAIVSVGIVSGFLCLAASTLSAQLPTLPGTGDDPFSPAPRLRGPGMGGFAGGRGILGTVTEITPNHYMLKTDAGELYTVHYSVNTRIMKQPPGARTPGQGRRTADRNAEMDPADVERAILTFRIFQAL